MQVVFRFGGQVHEVHLPLWQEPDASKAQLALKALEAEAVIVLQCLTCERGSGMHTSGNAMQQSRPALLTACMCLSHAMDDQC